MSMQSAAFLRSAPTLTLLHTPSKLIKCAVPGIRFLALLCRPFLPTCSSCNTAASHKLHGPEVMEVSIPNRCETFQVFFTVMSFTSPTPPTSGEPCLSPLYLLLCLCLPPQVFTKLPAQPLTVLRMF